VCGFGITTDVRAHPLRDVRPGPVAGESRAYLEQFAASERYFTQERPARSADDALDRLKSDKRCRWCSRFRQLRPGPARGATGPEVLAQVDGAMTFRGETVAQYVKGVHDTTLKNPALRPATPKPYTADIRESVQCTTHVREHYSIVPSIPACCCS